MEEYYLIIDNVVNTLYLAWEKLGEFYTDGCFGDIKIDRTILYKEKIILPTSKNVNGWNLYSDILPEVKDLYTPSEIVLTFDITNNSVYESHWYAINMCWISAESMGEYNKEYHKPTHWRKFSK